MDLFFPTSDSFSSESIFSIEQSTAVFLENKVKDHMPRILSLDVSVTKQAMQNSELGVYTRVAAIYVANEAITDFPFIVARDFDTESFAEALQVTSVNAVFGPGDENTMLGEVSDSSVDSGLVAAVICLSITLFIISCTVLYTAGGCSAMKKRAVGLCCKQSQDEHDIENKNTFPAQSYDDKDAPSIAESSVAVTAASGILGAISNDEGELNPLDGLGIKTPLRGQSNITGISDYADSEIGLDTPMSEMTTGTTDAIPRNLGITSMRKLKPPTPERGAYDMRDNDQSMDEGMNRMIFGRLENK